MRRSVLSRSTQIAIAALGYMAEQHADPSHRVSVSEISKSRGLQAPFVSKILGTLSRAGLVEGSRGPGGGYRLARPPGKIALKEIADLFEREDVTYMCPYGKDYCGHGPKCPLHDQIVRLNHAMDRFLAKTTLVGFGKTRRKTKSP